MRTTHINILLVTWCVITPHCNATQTEGLWLPSLCKCPLLPLTVRKGGKSSKILRITLARELGRGVNCETYQRCWQHLGGCQELWGILARFPKAWKFAAMTKLQGFVTVLWLLSLFHWLSVGLIYWEDTCFSAEIQLWTFIYNFFSRVMARARITANTGTFRLTTAYLHHHSWDLES